MSGVCLEAMGGDGARDGSKEGARRGVFVEDANECRNKTDSYLLDRTGCIYISNYTAIERKGHLFQQSGQQVCELYR